METQDDFGGAGSAESTNVSNTEEQISADVSRLSADVDVGRLRTRVPFDMDEVDFLLGTVPSHLLRCSELEQRLGKEAFKSWYGETAKNREKYLTTYPDIYGSDTHQEVPPSSDPKEPVDDESAYDTDCDSIPDIIRVYNEAQLEDDEIGCDVTKEAVERRKSEYKRLNDMLKTFGTPALPLVPKPLTWPDQFVGAVEKETGVPFDQELAEHMADLAAGKDSDVSIHAYAPSLDVKILAESDSDDDERCVPHRKLIDTSAATKPPVKKEPYRPKNMDNLNEPPSAEEPYSLEKELQRYVGLKTRLLLSRVHDDGKINWKKNKGKEYETNSDVVNLELDEWYFGPKEFIVLKDEGGKKTRTDIVVDRDEDLCEKIAVIEGVPAEKKFKLMSSGERDKNNFLKRFLTPRDLKELGIETGQPDDSQAHQEQIHNIHSEVSPEQEIHCEVLQATEEEREKRLHRRKMFRWERFQFRDVRPKITESGSKFNAAEAESKVSAERLPEVPDVPTASASAKARALRRRQIADSVFRDDSRKFVEYVDPSEMTGWELHRPVPILTAASLAQRYVPEPDPKPFALISKTDKGLPKKSVDPPEILMDESTRPCGASVPTASPMSVRTSEPVPTVTDPCPTTADPPVPKKDKIGSKKDKKKKKRRSSSSSDDLEMLEKKSEARLGLRK